MSSKPYNGNDPSQKLQDIAERLSLIRTFTEDLDETMFVQDQKTSYAVRAIMEDICEAAYWLVKNEHGQSLRDKYPDLDFNAFGLAGNVYRHHYWHFAASRLWHDLHSGKDIAALESMLENELPFYRRNFPRGNEQGR